MCYFCQLERRKLSKKWKSNLEELIDSLRLTLKQIYLKD